MPRVSQFFGITIAMYCNDHAPAHFHAFYSEHEALVVIETLDLYEGSLPRRALALVLEWAALHRAELRELGTGTTRPAPRADRPIRLSPGAHAMTELVRIRAVTALDGFRVRIGFTDGSEREVDLEPYLRGPIFEPLRQDPGLFAALQIDPEQRTIVWPNGADIDPDVLYHGRQPASWAEPSATRTEP